MRPKLASTSIADELEIAAPVKPEYSEILSDEALRFVGKLIRRFTPLLELLLKARTYPSNSNLSPSADHSHELPYFLPTTEGLRKSEWKIGNIPEDLQDRRVEITGPADRKMVINALNASVSTFMADFEDSLSPTWDNVIQGQINLRDAVAGTIEYTDPDSGKEYRLNEDTAVLICRVRGLHLSETRILWRGEPIPASLFDFGMYLFHNYRPLLMKGTGPYFYIPKIENYREARWWDQVFAFAEQQLILEHGTIKATVLIETLPAAFQMDEILFEMRDHIVGLNCGRWDYIFSYIKTLRHNGHYLLPDRRLLTMDQPFLNAYSRLLVRTCHRRGALAIGGMSAYVPVRGDLAANEVALERVRADKELEAKNGHDGTWIAHPGLADVARDVFDSVIEPGKRNQLHRRFEQDAPITAKDLLTPPTTAAHTEGCLRNNIRVALLYIASWLSGRGAVTIRNLMEDAATAEISRTQLWQLIRHRASLLDGTTVTPTLVSRLLRAELSEIRAERQHDRFQSEQLRNAADLLEEIVTDDELVEFITLRAYEHPAFDPTNCNKPMSKGESHDGKPQATNPVAPAELAV